MHDLRRSNTTWATGRIYATQAVKRLNKVLNFRSTFTCTFTLFRFHGILAKLFGYPTNFKPYLEPIIISSVQCKLYCTLLMTMSVWLVLRMAGEMKCFVLQLKLNVSITFYIYLRDVIHYSMIEMIWLEDLAKNLNSLVYRYYIALFIPYLICKEIRNAIHKCRHTLTTPLHSNNTP